MEMSHGNVNTFIHPWHEGPAESLEVKLTPLPTLRSPVNDTPSSRMPVSSLAGMTSSPLSGRCGVLWPDPPAAAAPSELAPRERSALRSLSSPGPSAGGGRPEHAAKRATAPELTLLGVACSAFFDALSA